MRGGSGVTALFVGPSGTGKTLAAEAVARELGFDMYRIDLPSVVSKYIGETEKNLDRVFAAAEHANAVLFFDEADALFGKRSEVKDAHDRYANIEIAYLLQKMEQFDGLAILATNLKQNLDEAFARRLTFTVNFPFPEESGTTAPVGTLWPPRAPRGEDVDLRWFARRVSALGRQHPQRGLRCRPSCRGRRADDHARAPDACHAPRVSEARKDPRACEGRSEAVGMSDGGSRAKRATGEGRARQPRRASRCESRAPIGNGR